MQESFVSELEAELGVLAERAQQAEAQAAALEETLKVGGCGLISRKGVLQVTGQ